MRLLMTVQLSAPLQQLVQKRIDLDRQISEALIEAYRGGAIETTASVPKPAAAKAPEVDRAPKAPKAITTPKTKGKRNDVTGILSKILLAGGDFKPKELVEKSGLKSTSVSAWLNTEKNKEGGIVKWNEEAGTYSAASSTPAAKAPAKAKAKAKAKPKAGKAKVSKKKA